MEREVRNQPQPLVGGSRPPQLWTGWATCAAEVRLAQELRHEVFAGEMGARLSSAASGIDQDAFDPYCDHLLVREGRWGPVIGTYRALTYAGACAAGGFYSETEFDLEPLAPWRSRTIEVGRGCVHRAYRNGGTIAQLWAGLFQYVLAQQADFLIGCASIGTDDGGHLAASICRRLLQNHLGPAEHRVAPRRAFVLEGWREVTDFRMPPLIRGYLRLGAYVCGDPAWDSDFRTADLLLMLPLAQLSRRHAERLQRTG